MKPPDDRGAGRRRRAGAWLAAPVAVLVLATACGGCAAPFQRASPRAPSSAELPDKPAPRAVSRPTVGVAFGGGSARGFAHVGVIRWFEEHRIPIDYAAGTSMGGLVGGAFALGMDAAELEAFAVSLDWDLLFGASRFAHKNVRRKADAREYPSRLEFGLRGGLVPPLALNSGEHVEWLLGRIAAPYFNTHNFDDLPTPFRAVAVDLLSAQPVVLGSGWVADAMRATMSLPLVFPPVEANGQVLVDGGAMDNVPADVVKAMGADCVVAINVGDLSPRAGISYTLVGVAGDTLDAMTRASTKRALAAADLVVDVRLDAYSSLDWRRAADLIEEGYRAAEAMRDRLLPLAVSIDDFEAWRAGRRARRRTELPMPAFLQLDGFAPSDSERLAARLARHIGAPLHIGSLEQELAIATGLDRYQTVTWRLVQDGTRGYGLLVQARVRRYAPPFAMLGVNVSNTSSRDFHVSGTARYLEFDTLGSGSELRVDATLGSDTSAAIELYRPLGATPFFVAPYAGAGRTPFDFVADDVVIARYQQTNVRVGLNGGVNLGRGSDVRIGAYIGRTTASIDVGDGALPELRGRESGAEIVWRVDTQDSPVVPSRGLLSRVQVVRAFRGPDVGDGARSLSFDSPYTRLSAAANQFWSASPANRLFVYAGVGTSFDSTPLPTEQFALGTPFRLGAFGAGELRGAHYYLATAGYLRRVGRLPDFVGGPVFAGAWLENGDAFDAWEHAAWRSNGGVGLVLDTLLGPVLVAGSWSFDGRWRTYFAVGRLFKQ